MSASCSCQGLQLRNCNCPETCHEYQSTSSHPESITTKSDDQNAAENKAVAKTSKSTTKKPKHRFNRILEDVYMQCASYNLKYCQFHTSKGQKNYLANSIKDIGILLCFLAANFVIFFTIASRIAMNISIFVCACCKWFYRFMFLPPKLHASKPPPMIKTTMPPHLFKSVYTRRQS